MKRLALVLLATLTAAVSTPVLADLLAAPSAQVGGDFLLGELETSAEAPTFGTPFLILSEVDARMEERFWITDCGNVIDGQPQRVQSATNDRNSYYQVGACLYPEPGVFCAKSELWVTVGGESFNTQTKVWPCRTVTQPGTDVSVANLIVSSGLEPHDPEITATAVGPPGAVDWDVSCNGDDDVYEVQSADTTADLSSQECASLSVSGAIPALGTICVRATIGGTPSLKACEPFTVTPQVIAPTALTASPTGGPEPLEDVSLLGSWSTNGGLVDLQFKADDSASCPASPGDDADCLQVEDFSGSSFNTLTNAATTFDYASDGTYQPQLTITDADGLAASVTIPGALTVTPADPDPDPIFGIRFIPSATACQRDATTGTCAVEMDPLCTGDAVDDITPGTLACGPGGTAQAGSIVPASRIGANVSPWVAHDTSLPYCNRMKSATFDEGNGGWDDQFGAASITHDSNDFPTGWSDSDGGIAAYVRVFINRELDRVDPDVTTDTAHYPEGSYSLTCTGNATLDLAGDATGADCACPNTCAYTVANATENGIEVIARTPFTSGTPSITITGPDACTGAWRNGWIEAVAPAKALRMVNWSRVNLDPPTTWATRTPTTRYSYSNSTNTTVATVPLEVQIDAANTTRTDLWLHIPDAANDDYITQAAALVAASLLPELKVYPELGNEIWNTASVFDAAHDRADAAGVGLCTAPCDEWFYFQMKRQMEVWGIFQAALSDARVVNVLALQNAAPERSGSTFMAYDPPGALAPAGTIGANVEVVAVAPYFNLLCPDGQECSLNSGSAGYDGNALKLLPPATWHEYMLADIAQTAAATWPVNLATHVANCALLPDCRVEGYEGSSHITLSGGGAEEDDTLVNAMWAAHTDPGIENVVGAYLERWRDITGGGLMVLFEFPTARGTKFNFWGHGEFYDTTLTAPKYLGAVRSAGSACASSPENPPTCTWSTSGAKTTSDSGFTREGVADTDAGTAVVTVSDPPAVADLSVTCNALEFFAQNVGAVDDAAPPCQTCTVRNAGQGTLSSTNTLTPNAAWAANPTVSPASQSTTTESDTVTVCMPDPDAFTAGDNFATLRIANSANAGDAHVATPRYSITTPAQGGDPAWWSGRDGSSRPLVPRGAGRGTLTMHNVEKRATPTMQNLLGAGLRQFDAGFSDSATENSLIYYSTYDRMNGVVTTGASNDCVPLSECGNNPGGNEDTAHLPWGTYRSQTTLVVGNTFKNSIFYNTTCTSSTNCPHSDVVQGLMTFACPATQTFAFINNRFDNADSGQQMHQTQWTCAGTKMVVLLQGNSSEQGGTFSSIGCPARGVGTYTGTRACGKKHFNVPNNGGQPTQQVRLWCIDQPTITLKGGGSGSNAVTANTHIIKVGACSSSSIVGSPTIRTYPNVESAIAGETALGEPVPDGIDISCKGRATPPAGCLSTVGDPD